MRITKFTPLLLLATFAWGCGSAHKMTAPAASDGASATRSLASTDRAVETFGAVYTICNATGANAVVAWPRRSDGTLGTPVATPTGGKGTGGALGSQGAVALARGQRLLFAVDAGSNDIATLAITPQGLHALGTTPSGGMVPVSLTIHDDLLFVLDDGGSGSIAGFRIRGDGRLAPIPGSMRSLGTGTTAPAQVSFTPDGEHLVVTEKAANAIVVFDVGRDGHVSMPRVQASAGQTPYGFAFGRSMALIVSEAAGGAANGSSLSSYHVDRSGALRTVTASAPTHQTAACWVAVPAGGEFAYATNAGSNSISGYRVGADGSLTLLDASGVAAMADGTPIDATFGADGRFLYVLNASAHSVNAYRRGEDGRLTALGSTGGLPAGDVGLAAL